MTLFYSTAHKGYSRGAVPLNSQCSLEHSTKDCADDFTHSALSYFADVIWEFQDAAFIWLKQGQWDPQLMSEMIYKAPEKLLKAHDKLTSLVKKQSIAAGGLK